MGKFILILLYVIARRDRVEAISDELGDCFARLRPLRAMLVPQLPYEIRQPIRAAEDGKHNHP